MDTNVPYIVHEGIVTRLERSNRRLWILCIIIFCSFVISNLCWVWYENQFEDVVTTEEIMQDVSQDSDDGGINTFIGGDYNGETTNQTDSEKDN